MLNDAFKVYITKMLFTIFLHITSAREHVARNLSKCTNVDVNAYLVLYGCL